MPAPTINTYSGTLPSTADPANFPSNAADMFAFSIAMPAEFNAFASYFAGRDAAASLFTYGGTANTITLTSGASLASVPDRIALRFRATAANTGATTINVDGLGAVSAQTATGGALPAGYIRTDVDTVVIRIGGVWSVGREAEYISNANGKAYRYANGLQICTGVSGILTSSETVGPIHRSDIATLTFPVVFSAPPTTTSGFEYVTGSAGWDALTGGAQPDLVFVRIFNPTNNFSTARVSYNAIGRWY